MTLVLPVPAPVRRSPAQKRSQDRITSLLDSTARLVDESGVHSVTTTDIARESRSSVGVIYRYFPNVTSLVDALTVRNVRVFSDRLEAAVEGEQCTWDAAAHAIIDVLAALMQHEPGFRVVGLGDSHHQGARRDSLNRVYLAHSIADQLHDEYRTLSSDDLVFHVDVAIEIAYGLLRRAFAEEGEARDRLLRQATEMVVGMVPQA
ncbi:hypothetical protein BH10ACT7_BH10ACT7_13400 [soil metagenome]